MKWPWSKRKTVQSDLTAEVAESRKPEDFTEIYQEKRVISDRRHDLYEQMHQEELTLGALAVEMLSLARDHHVRSTARPPNLLEYHPDSGDASPSPA